MAEIAESGGDHDKKGKKRAKKSSTKVDMTPMVDLAFLLLTFFVLTSTFSKPKALEFAFPAPPEKDVKVPEVKNGLTLILSKDDRVFYYQGEFILPGDAKGRPATELKETNFSSEGLHKLLFDMNKPVREAIAQLEQKVKTKQIADSTFKRLAVDEKGKKEAVTVLIKTDDQATYKNMIDVFDELNICQIGKKVVVDLIQPEYDLVKLKTQ